VSVKLIYKQQEVVLNCACTAVNIVLLLTAMKSRAPTLRHVISAPIAWLGVTAVTSLGDDVFVLRYKSKHVEVYDAVNCTLRRHITVHGLGHWSITFGLAACAHYNCLYVSDCSDYIHRAEMTGSNTVKKWSVAGSPAGLSVNKAHNVVVACYDAIKLQEYTTNGSLVREICLHDDTDPWHAVQLSSGDYVVSQFTSPGVVSVVGIDGQVRHSYGQSQTSSVGQMKYPRGLAVTKNDDILVADSDNKRILSMNSSLSSVQELTLPVDGGIQQPCGLCLDDSRGRLYVCEYGGSYRVLVFDNVKLVHCNSVSDRIHSRR